MSVPTVGVEEEFLLINPGTGEPVAKNEEVARRAADSGIELQLELTRCQIETNTVPLVTRDDLYQQITVLRRAVADAAMKEGVTLLAVGLPPTVPTDFPITSKARYRQIGERYGMIAHEQGICGCHVHVEVPDRDAAIAVSNRLRWWLPMMLALTANSAIYRNADSGHASWRNVLWGRWPVAGPPPHLQSATHYDDIVAMMLDAGVLLDDGMVYWDVRPSSKFPTVEVRISDVPSTATETVLLATLIRAAVMTALTEARRGEISSMIPDHVVRAALWKASNSGLAGSLIDTTHGYVTAPAHEVFKNWIQLLAPSLDEVGDTEWVSSELDRLFRDGNGAMVQQRVWGWRNDASDVVAEAARATLQGCELACRTS